MGLAWATVISAVVVFTGLDGAAFAGPSLLDVPYMAQSRELCGGAAVSMVLRYWGADDVYPQDFAPLAAADGIPATTLTAAVRARGWQAFVVPAAAGGRALEEQLAQGRPLIALVAVAPAVFHYVVVVGATPTAVVVHDPAVAPYRVLDRQDFDAAWAAAERWSLLILPDRRKSPVARAASQVANPKPRVADRASDDPCAALVEAGVRDARAGRSADATQRLQAAAEACPESAAAWQELAGLQFAASAFTEAAALADHATRLDPDDAYAWQLLGASRFLAGDDAGALQAWNRAAPPRVDLVTVRGAERTRRPVVVDAVGLEPREPLTPAALARARRRVQAIPVFTDADVRYAVRNGGASIEAVVSEPPVFPHGLLPLATLGVRPLFAQEVEIDLAGPTGSGERWTGTFRWPDPRRRVAFGLATPAPGPVPGIVSIEGSWERQSYAFGGDPDLHTGLVIREERNRGAAHLSSWATGWLRWTAGGALDRLRDQSFVDLDAAADVRLFDDRAALGVRQSYWLRAGRGAPFSQTALHAGWRSTADPGASRWMVLAQHTVASEDAPFALWPGADSGQSRDALIRAHPLLDDDIVRSEGVFGRRLVAATVEYERPVRTIAGARIGVAAFVDLARASARAGTAPPIWQADVGVGGRLHGGGLGATARLDLAVGLRDGRVTLSVGWAPEW